MITPSENLGNLDNIPLEIQHAIIGYLDVNSLLVLRRVSCKAISVVDSMLEWQKVCALLISSFGVSKANSIIE
jgi:hypothetical protein